MPIVSSRPRLLITAADLPGFKARAAANDPLWQLVLNDANAAMNDPNRWGGTALIYNLDLAYLVTGNVDYADRATGLAMTQVNGGPASWARDSGYDSRDRLPALCVHYDWAYNRLTPQQRSQILAYIEGWVDWIWQGSMPVPGTSPLPSPLARQLQEDYDHGRLTPEQLASIDAAREIDPEHWPLLAPGATPFVPGGAYSVKEPGSNYYHGHWLGSQFVALVGSGDSQRTQYFMDLADQKLAGIVVYQRGPAAGGFLHEGTSYGMAGMLQNLFLGYAAYRTATGTNRFDSWCDDAMKCKLAMTTSDLKGVVPFGDQASDTKAFFSDISYLGGLLSQEFSPSELAAATVRNWLRQIRPNTKLYYWNAWSRFAYPVPLESEPAPDPPATYYAPGTGYAVRAFP